MNAIDIDIETAIDEALEGKPRSADIGLMVEALESRRASFVTEWKTAASDKTRATYLTKLREVDDQIELLNQERVITDFVERSIRAASRQPRYDAMDAE